MQEPEKHWVRTDPSGTAAETPETALPWDQSQKPQTALAERMGFVPQAVSLDAGCLCLALTRWWEEVLHCQKRL